LNVDYLRVRVFKNLFFFGRHVHVEYGSRKRADSRIFVSQRFKLGNQAVGSVGARDVRGKAEALNAYHGEFMQQYAWARPMAAELSEDKTKCRIIDSAPSATFSRIKNGKIYYTDESGAFIEAASPADIPGAVYYFENDAYGGMTYWMDIAYVARRGVRLIQPQ